MRSRNYIILGLLIVIAVLLLFNKCGSEVNIEKSNNDSLFTKIKNDSLRIVKLESDLIASDAKNKVADSLKVIAECNYESAKKRLREKLKNHICDTLEVEVFITKCDSAIEANHEVVAQRDSTIKILRDINKEQADEIEAARTIIKNKANDIVEAEKTLKKTIRRNKIKTALIIIGDVIKDGLLIFALK